MHSNSEPNIFKPHQNHTKIIPTPPPEIISGISQVEPFPGITTESVLDFPEKNYRNSEEIMEDSEVLVQKVGGKTEMKKKKESARSLSARSYSQDTPVTQKQPAKVNKKSSSRRVTPERDTRTSLETHAEEDFSDKPLNKSSSILEQVSRNIKGLVKSLNIPSNEKKEKRKSVRTPKKQVIDKPISPKPSTPHSQTPPLCEIPLKYDFSKIPLPPIREEGGDQKELYERLQNFFLSPEASTENGSMDSEKNSVPEIDNDNLIKILFNNVEDIDSMLDRSGSTPVSQYIISTYQNGLPLLSGNEVLQNHTIHAMKVIFHKTPSLPEATRKSLFRRLAEAYTACQMEQCRVIDSIFGIVTGRDLSLGQQILCIVDIQKDQVLNQVVNHFNPEAWKTTDDNPRGQVPHIQSSYCIAIGKLLGLRGVSAAYMDRDAFEIHPLNIQFLLECFKRLFSVQDLINTLISDINQQEEGANRLVNRDTLTKWAGDTSLNNGFPSHSIFYDEDNAKEWPKELGIPKEENKYSPFINNTTALKILENIFIKNSHKM